jgi:hypothetical protein
VAQKEDGSQEFLSAEEFARRYGWRNDPAHLERRGHGQP